MRQGCWRRTGAACATATSRPRPRWSARSPVLPPHDFVEGATARRELGLAALACRRMSDGDGADRPIARRHTEGVHQSVLAGEDGEEQGAQAEVDSGEQD